MVLLLRRATGDIGPPLFDEEVPEGDLGEVVFLVGGTGGFSTGTMGVVLVIFGRTGRDTDPVDNRC